MKKQFILLFVTALPLAFAQLNSTLTVKQIDKLHLDYKKEKLLLKTQLKQAKVELGLLITSDSPKKADTSKKIEEILKLKKSKMTLKVDHKIAVRKILNEEQRVAFDMHVLKNMYHGKRHRKH